MTDSVDVEVCEERDDGEWLVRAKVNYGYSSAGAYYHANPLEVVWTDATDPEGNLHKADALDWLDDDAKLRDAASEQAQDKLREGWEP